MPIFIGLDQTDYQIYVLRSGLLDTRVGAWT